MVFWLNRGNFFLLQVIQFLAACGEVIIFWRHLWTTSVSSFMRFSPSIRIYQLGSQWTNFCKIICRRLSLISAERIGQKHVNSRDDLGSFHIAENDTYSSAVQTNSTNTNALLCYKGDASNMYGADKSSTTVLTIMPKETHPFFPLYVGTVRGLEWCSG